MSSSVNPFSIFLSAERSSGVPTMPSDLTAYPLTMGSFEQANSNRGATASLPRQNPSSLARVRFTSICSCVRNSRRIGIESAAGSSDASRIASQRATGSSREADTNSATKAAFPRSVLPRSRLRTLAAASADFTALSVASISAGRERRDRRESAVMAEARCSALRLSVIIFRR